MIRLFAAVPLPWEIQERLSDLAAGLPGARWVPPENMHITLRFIGEVDRGTADDIDGLLSGVRAPAFELSFAGVGTFGSGRQVRAAWIGVEKSEALHHLRDKVESAAVRAGLEPERRKFTPHVTLARFKKASPGSHLARWIEAHGGFSAGPFDVDRFTLFQSHLGREGAHYEAVAEYPLDEFRG